MTEPSPFASLGPSLLARKGGARPAMRPQLQPQHHFESTVSADLEDLGWNDMGDDAPSPIAGLTPSPQLHIAAEPVEEPEVRKQQEALAERLVAKEKAPAIDVADDEATAKPAKPRTKKKKAAAPKSKTDAARRAAFTLRLDSDRHLKLRLASTMRGRSAQQIVTEALDKLLAEMPELNSLARQMKNS
ncbi:hypothetical protein QQS45_08030 [Alteriqipengyuania flavescens]|uniref:hypothetical protein n=1 Tax=Alteriqipengyuania flavescens TaxID=3053610 RepID=UPI0025B5F0E0|nr:hypothetical protein [Alteriqipengyuania flavescens]WJY17605.1 hypothetical protein QQW98_08020 [Alteriqipengyuania flavescens]WJY23548.1 hypothetical protein QQS45_08030 [Alteriqipengyuania flavescens]